MSVLSIAQNLEKIAQGIATMVASGGGASSIANGADVAQGSTTDAAASSTVAENATARTGVGLWKGIKNILISIAGLLAGGLPAALGAGGGLKVDGSGTALPVSGTFYQSTQPTSDAGPAWVTARGLSGLPFASADQHSGPASVTDAPTNGQKLCITDLVVSTDTQMSVTFKEETSGTIVAGPYYMSANSVVQITPRGKFKLPTANRKLQVLTSVAGNITVSTYSYSEA